MGCSRYCFTILAAGHVAQEMVTVQQELASTRAELDCERAHHVRSRCTLLPTRARLPCMPQAGRCILPCHRLCADKIASRPQADTASRAGEEAAAREGADARHKERVKELQRRCGRAAMYARKRGRAAPLWKGGLSVSVGTRLKVNHVPLG